MHPNLTTANPTHTSAPFDLVIGLERSDRSLDWCVLDTRTGTRTQQTIGTTPEALRPWAEELHAAHPHARYLAEWLYHHHAELRPWAPEDRRTRLLQQLLAHRRSVVDERTALTNRLQAQCVQLVARQPQLLTPAIPCSAKLRSTRV